MSLLDMFGGGKGGNGIAGLLQRLMAQKGLSQQSAQQNGGGGLMNMLHQGISQDPMTMLSMGGALMQPGDAGSSLMRAGMIGAQGAGRRRREAREDGRDKRQSRMDEYSMTRDALSDERYDARIEHQTEREGVLDGRYSDGILHRAQREGVMDDRYSSGLERENERYFDAQEHRDEREGISDERYFDNQERADTNEAEQRRQFDVTSGLQSGPDYNQLEVEDLNGNMYTLQQSEDPNVPSRLFTMDNQEVPQDQIAALGLQRATARQETRNASDMTSREYGQLREMDYATRGVIGSVDQMLGFMEANPDVVTGAGGIATIMEGAAENLRGARDAMLRNDPDASSADMQRIQSQISSIMQDDNWWENQGLGTMAPAARGAALDLAIARARMANPDGRLSDFDVRSQMDIIGFGSWFRSPQAVAGSLRRIRDNAIQNWGNAHQTWGSGDFDAASEAARAFPTLTPSTITNALNPQSVIYAGQE